MATLSGKVNVALQIVVLPLAVEHIQEIQDPLHATTQLQKPAVGTQPPAAIKENIWNRSQKHLELHLEQDVDLTLNLVYAEFMPTLVQDLQDYQTGRDSIYSSASGTYDPTSRL